MLYLLCQAATIVWFTYDFKEAFKGFSEQCKEVKEIVARIHDYFLVRQFDVENDDNF